MKKTLTVLALASALALPACAAPAPTGPAAHYTGDATIKDSYRNSRKGGCLVVVTLPNGDVDTLRVGRKTTCDGWTPNRKIKINDGRLVR